jgi:hypothetical protein
VLSWCCSGVALVLPSCGSDVDIVSTHKHRGPHALFLLPPLCALAVGYSGATTTFLAPTRGADYVGVRVRILGIGFRACNKRTECAILRRELLIMRNLRTKERRTVGWGLRTSRRIITVERCIRHARGPLPSSFNRSASGHGGYTPRRWVAKLYEEHAHYYSGSDVDSIQPGKDISCWDGSTLRITKRVGTSVEGATITVKPPNGLTQTFSAETATLSYSTNRITGKSLIITLHDANAVFGSETAFVGEFEHPIYLGK